MKVLRQACSAMRAGSSFITKAFGGSGLRSVNVCYVLKRHLSLFYLQVSASRKALIGARTVGFSLFGTEKPLAKHCLPSPVIGPHRKECQSLASAYLAELMVH